MKKLLTLAVVAFTAVQSFAIGLGIRDGFVIGGMTGDVDDYLGSGDALTFEMLVPFNDMFGVHVGAGFEMVGYSDLFSSDDSENNIEYVDLCFPVMARFNFNPKFFAEAGLNFGLNFRTWWWEGDYGDDSNHKAMDEASVFNMDLAIGAGYVFGFGLGLDGRFTYGLTDAIDYSYLKGGRWGIHFGISYWFKKR